MNSPQIPSPKLVRLIKIHDIYNMPEVNCSAFTLEGHDILFELVYDKFQIMVGYNLNQPFEILGFFSIGMQFPITAQDEMNKNIILTLLTIDLKKMATEVLSPDNQQQSNIIIGRN